MEQHPGASDACRSFFGQSRASWLTRFVGLELDLRCRKPLTKTAAPSDRPPVVKEDLGRPPVSDPSKDDKAFLEYLSERGEARGCGPPSGSQRLRRREPRYRCQASGALRGIAPSAQGRSL